jgi:heme oxygenase
MLTDNTVNIATRSIHSQLNRLILVRLPLALPPYRSSPSIYASGLLHVAPIYTTFESLWQAILDSPHLPTGPNQKPVLDGEQEEMSTQDSQCVPVGTKIRTAPAASQSKVYARMHSLLSHLQLPGLLRAQRLRVDTKDLTGMSESDIQDQLEALSRKGKLAEFVTHIRKSVQSNPHVLMAYAWVFYMALFSGGRYLRAALIEAGGERAEFWNRDPSPMYPCPIADSATRPWGSNKSELDGHAASQSSPFPACQSGNGVAKMMPGLQFFNFAGDEDGEDIKVEFKKRFVEAENLLTRGEKENIITEAEHVFMFMVEVVLDLDKFMDARKDSLKGDLQYIPPMDIATVPDEKLPKRTPPSTVIQEKMELGSAKDIKKLGSAWTKWWTSLLPMVLCIVMTSWYYGM